MGMQGNCPSTGSSRIQRTCSKQRFSMSKLFRLRQKRAANGIRHARKACDFGFLSRFLHPLETSPLMSILAGAIISLAVLLGAGDKANADMINSSFDVVDYNDSWTNFNIRGPPTGFRYNGETISERAVIFMIKDNAYAGGMDKNSDDYPFYASGHKNERSASEKYGYAMGEKTDGPNDDVIVLIDRDGNNWFDYNPSTGTLAQGSLDEIRKMSLGEVTLTGEDPYSGSPSYVTNVDVIPEPATLALLGLGGAGLAIRKRQRK